MPQNPTPAQPTNSPATPKVSTPPTGPSPTTPTPAPSQVPPKQAAPASLPPLQKSIPVGSAFTGKPAVSGSTLPSSSPTPSPSSPSSAPTSTQVLPSVPVSAPKPPVQSKPVQVSSFVPASKLAAQTPPAQPTNSPSTPKVSAPAPTAAPAQLPPKPTGPTNFAPAAKPPGSTNTIQVTKSVNQGGPKPAQAAPVAQKPTNPPAQNNAPKPKPPASTEAEGTLPPPSKIQKMPPPTPAPKPATPPPTSAAPAAAKPGMPPAPVPKTTPLPAPPTPVKETSSSALPPAPAGPPAATPPAPSKSPVAELKKSPLRFLPFVLGGLLLLGLVFFIFTRLFGGRNPAPTPSTTGTGNTGTNKQATGGGSQVTITYWGLWEPSGVIQEVISDFEKKNPKIKVNYQQQSYKDYRERLQTAIVSGRGPDVFRFHASWTPMLAQELSPAPTSVYPDTEFADTFYPVAVDQLTLNDRVVGVPLMYDGLALYYNEEVLRTANAQPPKTWAEVYELAPRLTIRSGTKIERAGIAIGNAGNVEHFSDILGLLMLQNGADLHKPTSQAAQDALLFYTNFVKVNKVWDNTLPSSTVAFARGDVAMMLAPSWRAHEIQAMNPNLKFGIAPVPQLPGKKVTWASYWAEGVSTQSKYKAESWTFLKYLSSEESLRKFNSEAKKVRGFGEIYSRRDMANDLANDPMLAAFVSDAPDAQNWYMNSFTHDNGLNDLLIKYYEDAINAVLESGEPKTALETVEQGNNQILRQYGIPTTSSSVSAQ